MNRPTRARDDESVPISRSAGLPSTPIAGTSFDTLTALMLREVATHQQEKISLLEFRNLELQAKYSRIGQLVTTIIGKLIEVKKHDFSPELIEAKVAELIAYSTGKSADEVLSYAVQLLGSLPQEAKAANKSFSPPERNDSAGTLPLPTVAPEKWKSSKAFRAAAKRAGDTPETPVDFLRRVYGQWEHKGLSRNLIRKLDRGLLEAYYTFVREAGAEPTDFYFPTVSDLNDELVDSIREQGGLPGTVSLTEARRISSAIYRRNHRE